MAELDIEDARFIASVRKGIDADCKAGEYGFRTSTAKTIKFIIRKMRESMTNKKVNP